MFYGGINSDLKATVAGSRNVSINDTVCTSGANSGTHCGGGANIRVVASGITKHDTVGYVSVIKGTRIDGGVAAAQGDSGGPVYKNVTSTRVDAVGMIQGIDDELTNCGTLKVSARCGKTVYYTSINTILRGIPGATLVVG